MSILCYCLSGKNFSDCCGDPSPNRAPPVGVHIYSGLFSKSECKKMIRLAEQQQRVWLTLKDEQRSEEQGKQVQKRDPDRVTQSVDMMEHKELVVGWMNRAIVQCIEPVIQQQIEFYEAPQLLRYQPGGLYKSHADSEVFDSQSNTWVKSFDRDVSLLIYLNDKYKGGGLRFNHLNYTYQPVAGDLVFFPSTHRYVHESLPIKRGVKYAIVSWSAVNGSSRVGAPNCLRFSPVRS
ncbi:MAG: prolyl hydroxylase family protein [Pseudomonadales bacterium]